MEYVEKYLQDQGITYVLHEHPAVFSCEEADQHCANVPGLVAKSLFLKEKKGDRYFLLLLPSYKKGDFKKMEAFWDARKLAFASAEELQEKLGLQPGSVSPLGLLNDKNHEVELCLDKDVASAEILSFHPNRNTASLEFSNEMFFKYLESLPNKFEVLD